MEPLKQTNRPADYGVVWDHRGRAVVRHDDFPVRIHLTDSPDDDHHVQALIEVTACDGAVVLASQTSTFNPYDVVSYGPAQWLHDEVRDTTHHAAARLNELHALHLQRTTSE